MHLARCDRTAWDDVQTNVLKNSWSITSTPSQSSNTLQYGMEKARWCSRPFSRRLKKSG